MEGQGLLLGFSRDKTWVVWTPFTELNSGLSPGLITHSSHSASKAHKYFPTPLE